MTVDVGSEYKAYRSMLAEYRAFADAAEKVLAEHLDRHRPKFLHVDVSSRVKEPISLYRKLLKKVSEKQEKYVDGGVSAIGDRVGLRIIVSCVAESEEAVTVVTEAFLVEPEGIDRKALSNRPDELRYLGIHVDAKLRQSDAEELHPAIKQMSFEVQVHTLSETAWAVISHPLIYKPYGTMPRAVASKVFRSVALVSLFDSEVDAAMELQRASPDYAAAQMLAVVDRLFEPWRHSATDDELSMTILDIVRPTYSTPFDLLAFTTYLESWVGEHNAHLAALLNQYETDERSPLIGQPEILVLIERLSNAKIQLRAEWSRSEFDLEVLFDIADVVGEPYQT